MMNKSSLQIQNNLISRFILASIFLFSSLGFCQSETELKLREKFWNTTSQEILSISIPENYLKESAVILKDHREVVYENRGKNVYSVNTNHHLIKVLDQSSLEYYSEIALEKDVKYKPVLFTTYKKEITIGIRIIKPDGKIVMVDVAEEEVEQDDKRKIAVPNLEIGDIIDFFIQIDKKEKESSGLEVYPAVETPLKDDYPILDYKITIEVEKDFFINMNTYNGAPAVQELETDRRNTKKYMVEAKNLDKLNAQRWYYPLVEEPSIKYQVAFAKKWNNKQYANIFIGENGKRKGEVTKEDLLDYFDRKFYKVSKSDAKDAIKHLKQMDFKSDVALLNEALDYMRFHKFTKYFEPVLAYQAEIVGAYPNPNCINYYTGLFTDNSQAVFYLRSISEYFDIDYDMIIAQPRYDGKLDDMLIKDNALFGLKFNTQPNKYFFDLDENTTLERFPYVLENAETYVGSVTKWKRIEEIKRSNLSALTAEDNIYKERINLSLTEDKEGFEVSRERVANGHFETRFIYSWIHFKDFIAEDYAKFSGMNHFYDCGFKKERQSYKERYLSLVEKKYEEFLKKREESVDEEWEGAKAKNYKTKVIETGRYGENVPLKIEESFTLEDGYIKKAGSNLIIEIGKFIGGQIEIEDKERERNVDIYLDFAKTYNYVINFTIPNGYKLEGVEALNTSVDNETGSFSSKAYMEGNTLILETNKIYKANYYKNQLWPDMLVFLDAALAFGQAKILLEKS